MGDEQTIDLRPDEGETAPEGARREIVESAPLTAGMILAGRYEIRKVIGRGGMGVVLEAHDRTLGEAVAIKIVRAEYAGERQWAERLAREVKLARQIQHPNVCRVFDFEQADGRVFLVMELATGGTLRDELRDGAAHTRAFADRIADARAVVTGLAAIHAAGIVHRDVALQNVLRMADGRLVLSDFGLSTDSSESTTSVHGGTVAYMAPEVVRGGRATIASDIWSLGVVIHEIVFGEKPRWRAPAGVDMLEPEVGRRLEGEEKVVLVACRACTAVDPGRRPGSARAVETELIGSRGWRRGGRARSLPILIATCALFVAAGGAFGIRRLRIQRSGPGSPLASGIIQPIGEPADWTEASRVLAEVPERIRCLVVLPDHHTLRFVWGKPPRAEDVDTETGRRRRSDLPPDAYANGCPDLSSEGRLLYQAHTPDGRAFAFVSPRPDGRGAQPIVQTAEPGMSSEPAWLSGGKSFSYDVDATHVGVFSMEAHRLTVLQPPTSDRVYTQFRSTIPSGIAVAAVLDPHDATEVSAFHFPSFERVQFLVPGFVLDLRSRDGRTFYYSTPAPTSRVIEVDPVRREARSVGAVRGQLVRYLAFAGDGGAFVSVKKASDAMVRQETSFVRVTHEGVSWDPAPCGQDIVVARFEEHRSVIVRLDRTGRVLAQLTPGPQDGGPACSPDGAILVYLAWGSTLKRCDRSGCRSLLDHSAIGSSVSPDGMRVAFIAVDKRGPYVQWMSLDGGAVHDVIEADVLCAPVWSSAQTIWISRKREGKFVWTEVEVASGHDTGKVLPGAHDCSDDSPDPSSPGTGDVRAVVEERSQVRLLPAHGLDPTL